jgi:arylsulfatase
VLGIDGAAVVNQTVPHTIPFLMTLDETFDIGNDTRTPVSDDDYQVPFPFTGTIHKLTYQLGPEQLSEADHAVIGPALARARD